jgi:hypothetical protein
MNSDRMQLVFIDVVIVLLEEEEFNILLLFIVTIHK